MSKEWKLWQEIAGEPVIILDGTYISSEVVEVEWPIPWLTPEKFRALKRGEFLQYPTIHSRVNINGKMVYGQIHIFMHKWNFLPRRPSSLERMLERTFKYLKN